MTTAGNNSTSSNSHCILEVHRVAVRSVFPCRVPVTLPSSMSTATFPYFPSGTEWCVSYEPLGWRAHSSFLKYMWFTNEDMDTVEFKSRKHNWASGNFDTRNLPQENLVPDLKAHGLSHLFLYPPVSFFFLLPVPYCFSMHMSSKCG